MHATAAGQVTLTRSFAALRPGTYGLMGDGVHAVVGPVIEQAPHAADTVVRRLERVNSGSLEPGTQVRLTPALHSGDPSTALGLDHADVEIPGELGSLPAWFVPGARDTWVITVHGLGTTREHPMNVMEFLHALAAPGARPRLPRRPRRPTFPGRPRPPRRVRMARPGRGDPLRRALRRRDRSSCTAGPPAPRWPCTRPSTPRCATGSAASSWTPRCSTGRPPCAPWPPPAASPSALLPLAVRAAQGRPDCTAPARSTPRSRRPCSVPTLIFHGPDDTLAPWQPVPRSRRAPPRPGHPAHRTAGPARGHVERRPGRLRRGPAPLPHAPDVT